MCGIGLTVAYSSGCTSTSCACVADVARWSASAEEALRRRGPDSQRSVHIRVDQPAPTADADGQKQKNDGSHHGQPEQHIHALFTGTVLHLRGDSHAVTIQPVTDAATGNMLCWNGEVFGLDTSILPPELFPHPPPQIGPDQNDTIYMLRNICALPPKQFGMSLAALLHAIEGPFSFLFFHRSRNEIWYGRDKLGRRSMVASVARTCSNDNVNDHQTTETNKYEAIRISSVQLPPCIEDQQEQWEEVSTTGVWCIDLNRNVDTVHAPSNEGAPSAASSSVSGTLECIAQPAAVPSSNDRSVTTPATSSSCLSSLPSSAPFSLWHVPYPHVHRALQEHQSTQPQTIPHHPLDDRMLRAHSLAVGVQLLKGIPPYQRKMDANEEEQVAWMQREATALHLPPPLSSLSPASQLLYHALAASVARRVQLLCTPSSPSRARVGVLFSGGVDCMVLAMLAHRMLPKSEPIDLINVAFCGELHKQSVSKFVPDRVTAINGWRELKRASSRGQEATEAANGSESLEGTSSSPSNRVWNLIKVDVSLRMLERHRSHILELLRPAGSVMDFNLAAVLWFGSMGRGVLHTEPNDEVDSGVAGVDHANGEEKSAVSANNSIAQPQPIRQSRLCRLADGAAAEKNDANPSSSPVSPPNATTPNGNQQMKPKSKVKGKKQDRILPPELLAKLAAKPLSAALMHKYGNQATQLNSGGRVSSQLAASAETGVESKEEVLDAIESSPSPTADNNTATDTTHPASASASAPALAQRLTKAERRSQKRRERHMIRSYFQQQAAKQKEEEEDDEQCLPKAQDFPNEGEESDDIEYDDLFVTPATLASSTAHVSDSSSCIAASQSSSSSPSSRFYTSSARVLLLGIGADEQLAGYGRHRTSWRVGGHEGLTRELSKDLERLWRRNLGRDDRIVSDSGREARHPFLDERLVSLLAHRIPLTHVADMSQPPGIGDKAALRQVAKALGLDDASRLVKRAMQFGSRIANKKVAGYVTMDSSIVMRDIVNPFFLRPRVKSHSKSNRDRTQSAAPVHPDIQSHDHAGKGELCSSGTAVAGHDHDVAYDTSKPPSQLDKRLQKSKNKPGFE